MKLNREIIMALYILCRPYFWSLLWMVFTGAKVLRAWTAVFTRAVNSFVSY